MRTWCAMFVALVPNLSACRGQGGADTAADTVERPDTMEDGDSDSVDEFDVEAPDEADTVDAGDALPGDSDMTPDDSDTIPDTDTDRDTAYDSDTDVEAVSYTWTPVNLEAAFAPRDGAGAVVLGGRMWLLGGWNPLDPTHFPAITNSEVWSSADGLDWTLELLEAPWEGRHTAGYVSLGGRMWVIGGDVIRGHYQNDVWSSGDGRLWERATERVPWHDRALFHTATKDGVIYVMGGQTLPQFAPEVATTNFYNDVWRSEDGANWTRITDDAGWRPRGMIGGQAVLHGRIWLLGGGTYDTPEVPAREFHNDVWSSADGVTWRQDLAEAPWRPRQYHDVAAWDGRLWVIAGYYYENLSDVWHSTDGKTWLEVPETPWVARHASSVFVHDDALWVVTGNNLTSDVWKLTRSVGVSRP